MRQNILYTGTIRHRRFIPTAHEFEYKLFYFYVNPNDLHDIVFPLKYFSLNKLNYMSFYRKHYIGSKLEGILESIQKILQIKDIQLQNNTYMMTQCAYLGYCFNPISLYFIYDKDTLHSLVADVHNTPWGEKHAYVLNTPKLFKPPNYQYQFEKKMHVSPFMQMDFQYDFNIKLTPQHLLLHMNNTKRGKKYLDVTLDLHGQPLTPEVLDKIIWQYPFMSYKIILAIYWQAMKLFLKRVPFVAHP